MARWQGTTTQRGYGGSHQTIREQRLALYRPGDQCAMGGEPMPWWPLEIARQYIDLPHDHVNGGYLPGLACREHNRGEGASRSKRAAKIQAARPGDVRCKTCGQPYHYTARSCAICGQHYHPNYDAQRTCGRQCGVELRRRIYGYAGSKPRKPKPPRQQREPRTPKNGWPATPIVNWQCRYCGRPGIRRATAKPGRGMREVCDTRICQLARLQANNLVARNGVTREDADAHMAELVATVMARRRPSTEGHHTQ
jgi:hypothetical protein